MASLTVHVRGLVGESQHLGKAFPAAVETALDYVEERTLDVVRRFDQRTYDRPIPQSRSGRPGWKRSGAFKASPQGRFSNVPGVRVIRRTGPAAKPIKNHPGGYAQRLANIPGERANPSFSDTIEVMQTQAPDDFLTALKRELNL